MGKRLKEGIDERRHGAALGEDKQSAEHQYHSYDREQPELFAHSQERPKFAQETHSLPPKTDATSNPAQGQVESVRSNN
jgi:hypothetical protein